MLDFGLFRVYWLVWIWWPGTSDPQEYKALVDTGAQCTLMPSEFKGSEPICISGVTGGSQELSLLEAEVSLTGQDWQKHPIVTGPEAPCILGIDYLRRGYFKDPKGYRWAFGIAAVETEEIKQLSILPGLSEDPSVAGLLRVEEQQVPIATTMVHRRQYRTNRDSLPPGSQSTWCRQQLYNSSTRQKVQFWHLPGGCDSRPQEFLVGSGGAWSAQLTALYKDKKSAKWS